MLAVGTVVANRVKSGRYGPTFCDVVAQKNQFAPGVMTRSMIDSGAERARRNADAVLAGKRHAGVRDAMFFHTAGLRFPYPNMHYVLVAGGNAFYEKRSVTTAATASANARSRALALAFARVDPTAAAKPIVVASLAPAPRSETPSPAAAETPAPAVRPVAAVSAPVPVPTPAFSSVPTTLAFAPPPAPVDGPIAVGTAQAAEAAPLPGFGDLRR
ncbi:cell wall hydrolase [Methylopila musalis]|uniref:Cell wall hydrolase n=1 Tax=Methylopila musalis TaxID=1134781 RepID=A0ABW3Z963_9HYPH